MSPILEALAESLRPTSTAVLLASARLLPVAFLCPLLGGFLASTTVRLGLVLSLSLALHYGGGLVGPPIAGHVALGGLVFKEMLLGTSIGLLAGLPFETARVGGRVIDMMRGTSAEATLPGLGTRESATGEGLHQLMTALAASGGAMSFVVAALWRSFGAIGLGVRTLDEAHALQMARIATGAMATSLALAAPVVALSLAIDLLMGILTRAAPGGGFRELASPLKILGGGVVLWVGVGLLSHRLLDALASSMEALPLMFGASR